MECTVTGLMHSTKRSLARGATTSGSESFTYLLRASGNTFVIKGQHETVLQRRDGTY